MPHITFQNQRYALRTGETVLDGLSRQGAQITSACRSGICQSCMMRAVDGTPPAESQQGLKEALREQHHFLSCLCKPEHGMVVALPGNEELPLFKSTLLRKVQLSPNVVALYLQTPYGFTYKTGQFVNVHHNGLVRSYSLASLPETDDTLELQIQRIPNGRMSRWLCDESEVGVSLTLQGPYGECVYKTDYNEQPLLLIGTGCGLAPLWGILRTALHRKHAAPIHLFHGSRDQNNLYLVDKLNGLARQYPHFNYTPCLSQGETPHGYAAGRANDVALARHPRLQGWQVFLCGNSEMVKTTKKRVYLAGAALPDIHADPFEPASAATTR